VPHSPLAAPTSYTRMFPELRGERPRPVADMEFGLTKLGREMYDDASEIGPENEPDLPTAGYTYWGQFIDHDLTFDLTPLDNASDAVEQVRNFRTPFLDLDHLYGSGPGLSPFLYQKGFHDAERLLVGETTAGRCADLPRNREGIALVADPRQDENLIIAQLHVAFLQLHNLVVTRPQQLAASPYYLQQPNTFTAAQRLVKWHYQWLVRHDYLHEILDPEIFNLLGKLEAEKLALGDIEFRMPAEFTAAAFRFGHSMPRDLYSKGVNDFRKDVRLETLLSLTGPMGLTTAGEPANTRLPDEWVVSWDHFFLIPPRIAAVNRARKIDTQIAKALHHLDPDTVKLFNLSVGAGRHLAHPELPVRTLLRGFRMRLPSGEQVAERISAHFTCPRTLQASEIADNSPRGEILREPAYGLEQNTPLWYYVLKEAELLQSGWCLGPVGSVVIADVIISALAADPDSYLHASDWHPTLTDDDGRALTSMAKVLQWVSNASTTHSST